ncbi:MAG: PAS domain S-box protein, partial [Verrucomicrobiota bacterium]
RETSREEILLKNGRVFDRYSAPMFGGNDRYYGRVWYFRDITERKRAEEKLKLFRTLIERSSDGIYVVDSATGRFLDANESACQALGYTRDELLALTLFDVTVGVSRAEFEASNANIEEKGHDTLEVLQLRKDGSTYPAEASLSFVMLHRKYVVAIVRDITERKRAQIETQGLHQQLVESSRLAGMAEIATNVLHNVGNALNSINISTDLIVDGVGKSSASSLARIVALLQEHARDLGEFIMHDPNGRHVPAHLARLAEHLLAEQAKITGELESLRRNVEHIKDVVATQQNYATVGGVTEKTDLIGLVEDSLRLNEDALRRHGVEVVRELEKVPPMIVEKHKILQILVNLVRNAKYACDESGLPDRHLTVCVAKGDGRVRISVMDDGIGIPPENLTRIFNYGFTTRNSGHGFGLHSSALAAKELGGSLTVQSDGAGQGAAFTLELPCPKPETAHE